MDDVARLAELRAILDAAPPDTGMNDDPLVSEREEYAALMNNQEPGESAHA
jgi:hypothetical protein